MVDLFDVGVHSSLMKGDIFGLGETWLGPGSIICARFGVVYVSNSESEHPDDEVVSGS